MPSTTPTTAPYLGVVGSFDQVRDLGRPIPPEVSRLNSLTDEMVAMKSIDAAADTDFVGAAALIMAHNAAFDRKFASVYFPYSRTNPGLARSARCRGRMKGSKARLSNLASPDGVAAMTIKGDNSHRVRTRQSPAAIWAVRQLTGPTPASAPDGPIFGDGTSLKNGIQRALKRLGKKAAPVSGAGNLRASFEERVMRAHRNDPLAFYLVGAAPFPRFDQSRARVRIPY